MKKQKTAFEETADDKGLHIWDVPSGPDAYKSYPVAEIVEAGMKNL